jgi:hypothetical protein
MERWVDAPGARLAGHRDNHGELPVIRLPWLALIVMASALTMRLTVATPTPEQLAHTAPHNLPYNALELRLQPFTLAQLGAPRPVPYGVSRGVRRGHVDLRKRPNIDALLHAYPVPQLLATN